MLASLMIEISEPAREELARLKASHSDIKNSYLRMGVKGSSCTGLCFILDFDNQIEEGDKIIINKELKIVIDPRSFSYLCNSHLDFCKEKGFYFVKCNKKPDSCCP